MTRICATALIAGLGTIACPRLARAQSTPPPVDLTWRAPAECPSREWVLAEIARLLSASRNPRIPTNATVAVDRDESARWRGKLSVDARDAHSERALEAENCTEVAEATALVLAIAVEGGVPPAPVQATSPTAPASAPAPSQPVAAAPPPVGSQLVVSVAAFVEDGAMPSAAPGGEVALGWIYTGSALRIRALGAVSLYPSQSVRISPALAVSSPGSEGGDFSLVTSSVRGCASLVRGAFDVGPCLGAEVGFMNASGEPTATAVAGHGAVTFSAASTQGQWVSIVGGGFGSWSLSRVFALFVRADALLSLAQPSFVISNKSLGRPDLPVHSVRTWAGVGVFGLEVRFF